MVNNCLKLSTCESQECKFSVMWTSKPSELFQKLCCHIDRCDSGASSADNPRTAIDSVTARAAGLPTALTNTSMDSAPANPAS